MNTEQTKQNIFMYIKTHCDESMLSNIWILEKFMMN